MAIKALIFDFDGLILDTETPEYLTLQDVYGQYQLTMPIEEWAKALGASASAFDPIDYLAKRVYQPVDQESLKDMVRMRSLAMIEKQSPLPGVTTLLERADQLGLHLAVASSSPSDWVHNHLKRLNLHHRFHSILTRDDVANPKPHPELYLRTLEVFNILPQEAIVFEDSPNGIKAARAAGIFTVGVPNFVTRLLDTSHASLVLSSLTELTLEQLIQRASTNHH